MSEHPSMSATPSDSILTHSALKLKDRVTRLREGGVHPDRASELDRIESRLDAWLERHPPRERTHTRPCDASARHPLEPTASAPGIGSSLLAGVGTARRDGSAGKSSTGSAGGSGSGGTGGSGSGGGDGGSSPRAHPLRRIQDDGGAAPLFERLPDVSLELAMDLVPWVLGRHSEISSRLERSRRTLFQNTGVRLEEISLIDRSDLSASSYRILLRGEEVALGRLKGHECLALEATLEDLEGVAGAEPAFGMNGVWISPDFKEVARSRGFTVLGPLEMFLTHVGEVLHARAFELYGGRQLTEDLEATELRMPGLIQTLRDGRPGDGAILRVLRNLLEEGLSVRDLDTVLEALLEQGTHTQDPDLLTTAARRALRRHISRRFLDEEGLLHALILAPDLEGSLLEWLRAHREESLPHEVRYTLQRSVQHHLEHWTLATPLVLLCHERLRLPLRRTLGSLARLMPVLAAPEILSEARVKIEDEVHLARTLDMA